jgi:hypothetical protein
VLCGPPLVENGRKAGASSSSSSPSAFRPSLWDWKRGGRRIRRLCAGSESDDESDELDSAASEDETFFDFDNAVGPCPSGGGVDRTFVGGEIDKRCRVAFAGRGLVCGKGRLWMVFADDVRLSSGAEW